MVKNVRRVRDLRHFLGGALTNGAASSTIMAAEYFISATLVAGSNPESKALGWRGVDSIGRRKKVT